jgi:hypothetical protein
MFPQENKKLKRFKCFDKMPTNMDGIAAVDTLFILYQKSNDEKLIQGKSENIDDRYKQYHFMNSTVFPMQIFDYSEDFKRVNIREPKIMYKNKSYICKNMYRTIDVNFLHNWEVRFGLTNNFNKGTVFFIVELDTKVKGKYKIVQVNRPRYIEE